MTYTGPHVPNWNDDCLRCDATREQIEDGYAPVCALAGPLVWYWVRRTQYWWRSTPWRPSRVLWRIGL